MTGSVCRLQLLLVLARAVILRSESRGTHDLILLYEVRDSSNLKGSGHRIYIPQEQGSPVIPTGTGFHFRRLLRLAGLRWRYSTTPPHANCITFFHARLHLPCRWRQKIPLKLQHISTTLHCVTFHNILTCCGIKMMGHYAGERVLK
jgi:hypothetical protein